MKSEGTALDRQTAELEIATTIIAFDTMALLEMLRISSKSSLKSISHLAMLPLISMYAIESSDFLTRKGITEASSFRPYEHLLTKSRMRVKLLDDQKRSIEQVLAEAENLTLLANRMMIESNSVFARIFLKRELLDLGIYFIHGEPVLTTHIAFLYSGVDSNTIEKHDLSINDLGPLLKEVGFLIGQHSAVIMNLLQIAKPEFDELEASRFPTLEYCDVKASDFYGSFQLGVEANRVPECVVLTAILCQVQTARLIIPSIIEVSSLAAVKLRFILLFHALTNLRMMIERNADEKYLGSELAGRLMAALRSKSAQRILKYKSLRDHLVHYGMSQRNFQRLDEGRLLHGFIEAHCSGRSIEDLQTDIVECLADLSETLRSFLPFDLAPSDVL